MRPDYERSHCLEAMLHRNQPRKDDGRFGVIYRPQGGPEQASSPVSSFLRSGRAARPGGAIRRAWVTDFAGSSSDHEYSDLTCARLALRYATTWSRIRHVMRSYAYPITVTSWSESSFRHRNLCTACRPRWHASRISGGSAAAGWLAPASKARWRWVRVTRSHFSVFGRGPSDPKPTRVR